MAANSLMRNQQALQSAGVPIKSTTAAAYSKVLSTGPCLFLSAYCVANAGVAGWLLVYDLAAAPTDGAGQTPIVAVPVAAGLPIWTNPVFFGHPCQVGCTIVFSTTGPYTQTTTGGAAQFLSGQIAL